MVVNSWLRAPALAVLIGALAGLSQAHAADPAGAPTPAAEADTENSTSGSGKDFEDLSQQEKDAAKAAARTRKITQLRVCADPGNMPFSNDKGAGFENKIAELLATRMGATVTYAWRPTYERGLTRQPMNDLNVCDIMIGVPADYEALLTTTPIYRSTYVFAYMKDKGYNIKSLKDPILQKARIGVYETSGLRNALATHGVKNNIVVMGTAHDADLVPEHQPWHQVEQVVKGELDIAAVWGPFAGWVKQTQHVPLVLVPTNMMDDEVPMEFSVAIGVRKYDAVMKYALEDAMDASKQQIADILAAYGVPLVQCSECVVSGDIPAHGDYILQQPEDEFNAPLRRATVPRAQVDKWLKGGADINDEFHNAALAADIERMKYLLAKKGVDVNAKGDDGEAPLHLAATNGDTEMITLLLDRKADINAPDGDGYPPIALAAARNKVNVIKLLAARGANLEAAIPGGYTPLFVAIGEGKFAAAKVLIDAGAQCKVVEGPQHFTLLMAVATERPPERRIVQVTQGVGPVDIAQELVKRGIDANAVSTQGVTALMIAAARDNSAMIGVLMRAGARADITSAEGQTALDIALQNGNDGAARTLQLFAGSGGSQRPSN
jgi:quinoprotein dehydrogenase-associated probable ABC transporter substrate-binding protein